MWTLQMISLLLPIFILDWIPRSAAEANFCGMKDPDPDKTCVSLRLPWQEEPVYFCTDRENIKYRNQCGNHVMHCGSHYSKETLLLATPWDCCPISSVPDHCINAQCPPPPLNRTCQTIPPPEESSYECCPKYFCGEPGEMKKDCHYKQLEPGCTSHPKDRMNCIGFYDTHGCCTQFQCDGEGKPGMCPMEVQAAKYSATGKMPAMGMQKDPMMVTMNETTHYSTPMSPPTSGIPKSPSRGRRSSHTHGQMEAPPPKGGTTPNGMSLMEPANPGQHRSMIESGGSSYSQGSPGMSTIHEKHSYSIAVEPYPAPAPYPSMDVHLHCVGDYNCPGTMKCCSSDMTVYSDGMAVPRNTHPTHGFCVEPVMM